MTKRELIEELAQYSDDIDICIETPEADFAFAPVTEVAKEKKGFSEDPEGPILAEDFVVIIR